MTVHLVSGPRVLGRWSRCGTSAGSTTRIGAPGGMAGQFSWETGTDRLHVKHPLPHGFPPITHRQSRPRITSGAIHYLNNYHYHYRHCIPRVQSQASLLLRSCLHVSQPKLVGQGDSINAALGGSSAIAGVWLLCTWRPLGDSLVMQPADSCVFTAPRGLQT